MEVDTITQDLTFATDSGLIVRDVLTAEGIVATVTAVANGGKTITVELRRDGDVFDGVKELKIARADDYLGANDWVVDPSSITQIFEPVDNATGWPADNRETADWSVEVGSNALRDVYAIELSYTPHSPPQVRSRVEQVRRFRLCPTMTPIRWSQFRLMLRS